MQAGSGGHDGVRDTWRGRALGVVIGSAVTLFCAVIAVLWVFDSASGSEAIRTGGLVGGGVVALYALWLNDRRRLVEESRHQLERSPNEQDRERVADERFARAIELLGHDADQVRVGALHALTGLARNRPSSTQTVLDVLCSYLRRPFDHPDYVQARMGKHPQWTPEEERDAHRELQVRRAAQRLIGELVPSRDDRKPPPDLDLTAAVLDYLDLSGKALGRLQLRDAVLYGTTRLGAADIGGEVSFTRTACYGKVDCADAVFRAQSNFYHLVTHDRVTFERAHFHQGAVFLSARFHGPVTLAGCIFERSVDLRRTVFHDDVDLRATLHSSPRTSRMRVAVEKVVRPPQGWAVQPDEDGQTGRIHPS